MLDLHAALAEYERAGAAHEHVPVWGFLEDGCTFLTKAGDVGVVVRTQGVDYECLDTASLNSYSRRLDNAFKLFQGRGRIYQYAFKSRLADVPHRDYDSPIVRAAVHDRLAHFRRLGALYSLETYMVFLHEGVRFKQGLGRALSILLSSPREGGAALEALFSDGSQTILIAQEVERCQRDLLQRLHSFTSQVSDFLHPSVLNKAEAFRVLARLLNVDPDKRERARLKHDADVDYYLANSAIEAYDDHLRIDGYYARILTLKEPTSGTWPLVLEKLYEVPANYHVVIEWKPLSNAQARRRITQKRRKAHNTKMSASALLAQSSAAGPADVLVDEAKVASVALLGECLKEIDFKDNHFGDLALTVVVYDRTREDVDRAVAEFSKVFALHDGLLEGEGYNALNAFFATLPGNYPRQLRGLMLTNKNHVNYSFLFALSNGEFRNPHLDDEYLAIFETEHGTPYAFNLHKDDVGHTAILGRIGSGKSVLAGFLTLHAQKYDPYTFIFELGSSFAPLTKLFGGSYVRVGEGQGEVTINPFCLDPTPANRQFLLSFVRVLLEGDGQATLTPSELKEVHEWIGHVYQLDPEVRRLGTLHKLLPKDLRERLEPWVEGGPWHHLFDNATDTLTLRKWMAFDFEAMKAQPAVLQPLLFYAFHRVSAVAADPALASVFKILLCDEFGVLAGNRVILDYFVTALTTLRKRNTAVILCTQSVDQILRTGDAAAILDSCATKLLLANPDMDRELYRRTLKLNDRELEALERLAPKRQLLLKRSDIAKVLTLKLDPRSYWLHANDPKSNRKREEAFRTHGFTEGLEVLARSMET